MVVEVCGGGPQSPCLRPWTRPSADQAPTATRCRARYVAYRQAGYLTPFSVRRSPYKQKLFTMGTHIIKEYSNCRDTVRRGARWGQGRSFVGAPMQGDFL